MDQENTRLHQLAIKGETGVIAPAPPLDYQIDTIRQLISVIRPTTDQIDPLVLGSVLRNHKRENTNPDYEPLHPVSLHDGFDALVASGELDEAGGPFNYRIVPREEVEPDGG